MKLDMVEISVARAHTASGKTFHNILIGNDKVDYCIKLHHIGQGIGLGYCTGKSVKDETVFAVRLSKTLSDHFNCYAVRNKGTGCKN